MKTKKIKVIECRCCDGAFNAEHWVTARIDEYGEWKKVQLPQSGGGTMYCHTCEAETDCLIYWADIDELGLRWVRRMATDAETSVKEMLL